MAEILEKMVSGIGTLSKSLAIGIFGILGCSEDSSECVPQTEIVEQSLEMHRDSAQQAFHEDMLSMTLHKPGVCFKKEITAHWRA